MRQLDQLLSHLRYFKRLQQKQRHLFYNSCEFVRYKAQQKIFRQGEVGDYMYVILKGKVSVKVSLPGRDTVQVLMSMPSDGECFGEISIYDMSRIETKTVNVKTVDTHKIEIRQQETLSPQKTITQSSLEH